MGTHVASAPKQGPCDAETDGSSERATPPPTPTWALRERENSDCDRGRRSGSRCGTVRRLEANANQARRPGPRRAGRAHPEPRGFGPFPGNGQEMKINFSRIPKTHASYFSLKNKKHVTNTLFPDQTKCFFESKLCISKTKFSPNPKNMLLIFH